MDRYPLFGRYQGQAPDVTNLWVHARLVSTFISTVQDRGCASRCQGFQDRKRKRDQPGRCQWKVGGM